jgi:carbon monoxide dehydrogenase subunit G
MELVHDFTVPVPADQAFLLLVDVQKIAPCLPGAAVAFVDGDAFEGGMKIKLGPMSMTFKGEGVLEKFPEERRVVLQARGRDAKGNGGAQASVTASLHENGAETAVHVVTDLNVTGNAAQFGGGVMKDVSNRMLGTFADNLAQLIASGGASAAGAGQAAESGTAGRAVATTPTAGPSTRGEVRARPSGPAPAPFVPAGDDGLDAMSLLLGSSAAKAVLVPTGAALVGVVIGYLYGKNRTLERIVRRVL